MKKKAKKRSSAKGPQTNARSDKPVRVGGRQVASKVKWTQIGRRPTITDDGVSRIASALRSQREALGISIAQMAKKLDVAPATLIKFEDRGHGISVRVVTSFAEAVSCTLQVCPNQTAAKKKNSKR